MSITATCPNGHSLAAKVKLAGKRVKCPKCGTAFVLPGLKLLDADVTPLSSESHDGPAKRSSAAPPAGHSSERSRTKEESARMPSPLLMLAMAGGGAFAGVLVVGLIALFASGTLPIAPRAVDASEQATKTLANAQPSTQSTNAEASDSKKGSHSNAGEDKSDVAANAANAATSRLSKWAEIEEQGRRSGSWLVVNIETESDGSRTASVRNENGGGQFPEFTLGEGEGVPLFEYSPIALRNQGWVAPVTQPVSDRERTVLRNERETDIYHICKLSDFGTGSFERGEDSTQNFDHRHIWSPDGNSLYVLCRRRDGSWKQRLVKINTKTWEIEVEFLPSVRIEDLTWSSQGLVAVCDSIQLGVREFAAGETWVHLYPSTRRLQTHSGGLFLLDPHTLATRRGWITPRLHEVAGRADGDLVYLHNPRNALITINVKTGELLNCDTYYDLLGENPETERLEDLNFLHPRLSADGNWLTTQGMNNVTSQGRVGSSALGPRSVNRFRVSGAKIEFHQNKRVGGILSRFTRDCDVGVGEDYLCLPDERYEVVPANALSKPLGRLSLPPDTAVAVNSPSKTIFLCWPDWPAKKLKLRMLRGTTDTELTLDDGIVPTTRSTSPANTRLPKESRVHHNLWPFEMSVAPNGRGAIVFTPDAAYWVEPKFRGSRQWAFNALLPENAAANGDESEEEGVSEDERNSWARHWAQTMTKCKDGTALVLIPGKDTFGSAFCVNEQGYFLTNAFHVKGIGDEQEVSLIVGAGSFNERETTAKVVRIDREAGVALLKTEPHVDLCPLMLGDDSQLSEAAPLTAFGFTRVPERQTSLGRYPSVGVITGVATALRRTGSKLDAIQFDGVLLPGNSGGPVIDATGHVIGMVVFGIESLGLNFLVPASQLEDLAWPELRRVPADAVRTRPRLKQAVGVEQSKKATALVVLPNQQGFGTAFCVDQRGYFATNAHVVEGLKESEAVRLVINSGELDEQIANATVVRTMAESDLALLKTDKPPQGLVALEVDETTVLEEEMEVTALGFPFGDALSARAGEFPSVSVNRASIEAVTTTTLGHTAFEFRTQVNPGNSGGPVVGKSGQVVGVVFATKMGARKSYAIPAARLHELLFNPSFECKFRAVEYASRRQEKVFPVVVTPYLRSLDGLELSLSLKPEYGPEQVYPLVATDSSGVYEARAPLFSASVPDYVHAQFDFPLGSIRGIAADSEVEIGEQRIRLSAASEGTFLPEQDISGLETIVFDTGSNKVEIDASSAISAIIEPYHPSFVTYAIIANQDGRKIVGKSGRIDVASGEGVVARKHYFGKQLARIWSKGAVQSRLPPLKITATFSHGTIVGLAENRRFMIEGHRGPEEFDLRDVTSIKIPPLRKGQKPDAKRRSYYLDQFENGRLHTRAIIGKQVPGLETVPLSVGTNQVVVDLTTAQEVLIEPFDSELVKRFPLASPITDVVAGGGGKWLILRLPEFDKLLVFDVTSRKVVQDVPLVEASALIAAGREKLLIVFPEQSTIERWDLSSGQREQTAAYSLDGTIGAVAMGCGGSGPLLMHGYDSTELHQPLWMLVDPDTLETTRLDAPVPEVSFPTPLPLTASVEGNVFGSLNMALFVKDHSASVVSFNPYADAPAHVRWPPFLVSPGTGGQQLFYRNWLHSNQGQKLGEPQFAVGLPSYNADYCLAFRKTSNKAGGKPQVVVCENKAAALRPLVAYDTFPFEALILTRDNELPLRKRFHLYPDLRLLVSIPPGNEVLLLNEIPVWK